MIVRFRCACGETFNRFSALIDHEFEMHRKLKKS